MGVYKFSYIKQYKLTHYIIIFRNITRLKVNFSGGENLPGMGL